jgi:hypothetical protein
MSPDTRQPKNALLTQKRHDTFDNRWRNGGRKLNMLDLAMEEISGQPLWDYYQKRPKDEDNLSLDDDDKPFTGGAAIWCYLDKDGHVGSSIQENWRMEAKLIWKPS